MLDKIKSTTDKEELKKLLTQYLDNVDSDEILDTKEYIQSRPDLVEILKEIRKENKTSLKSLLAKIDEFNKEYRPELAPKNPDSMEERIELQKKYRS